MILCVGRLRGLEKISRCLEQFIFDELKLVTVANLISLVIGNIKNINDLMSVGGNPRVGHIEAEAMNLLG